MVDVITSAKIDAAWLLLITNLPGTNKTLRMRIWRALKAAGVGTLRDGVYALPQSTVADNVFATLAAEIEGAGGSTYRFTLEAHSPEHAKSLAALFDRTGEYQEISERLSAARKAFAKSDEIDARRRLAAITRDLAALEAIDFFPGQSLLQLQSAVADIEVMLNARFSPNEPTAAHQKIVRLDPKDYQNRTWVTREKLWIDRVCSAWLIRRFIDPKAKFVWCKRIEDRPKRAIGFDFNGAQFSHVDTKVTFEVLLVSFSLDDDPGLARLAALVHFLDVGGIPVAEAPGLAAIVLGARAAQPDDDGLLDSVTPTLDNLYQAFRADVS